MTQQIMKYLIFINSQHSALYDGNVILANLVKHVLVILLDHAQWLGLTPLSSVYCVQEDSKNKT